MRAELRRQLSTAVRVRDFAAAHPIADNGFATILKRLTDATAQADMVAIAGGDGIVGEHAARSRRRGLKQVIRRTQLRRLVDIATMAAQTHPELKGEFVMPPVGTPSKSFLVAARALLAGAVANQELFVSLGLGDTFIAELTKDTDQMEAETTAAHADRDGHILSGGSLKNLARECRRDTVLLGTYYRAAYPSGSEILVGWTAASRVARQFRTEPDVPVPVPAPAGRS